MPKPRVPPYPRPVPLIEPDEAPICGDTIVYEKWTDEAEQEAVKRASKRRKLIQECANSYLRDEPVFILSASLKGPFEGWKNPWQKKRQVDSEVRASKKDLEVPETTIRPVVIPTQAGTRNVAQQLGQGASQTVNLDGVAKRLDQELDALDRSHNVYRARDNQPNAIAGGQSPTRARRVEDWLRTNAAYSRRLHQDANEMPTSSSPTPLTRPRSGPELNTKQTKALARSEGAGVDQNYLRRSSEPPVSFALSSNHESSLPTHDSPLRAENAILQHKRSSVHKVPPSTSLPGFEFRRVGQKKKTEREIMPLENAQVVKSKSSASKAMKQMVVTGKQEESHANVQRDSSGKRQCSNETSKVNTSNQLPSAQIVPAPIPPTEAQTTDESLWEISRGKTNGSEATHLVQTSIHGKDEDASIQTREAANRVEDQEVMAEDPHPQNDANTPVKELDTQEMIAAIKPIEFSTVKKPLNDVTENRTSTTASKAGSKRKKRASFVTELGSPTESRGSIKKAMKVTKSSTPIEKHAEKSSQKVSIYIEPLADADSAVRRADENGTDGSLPSLSSMFGSRNKSGPKSILKQSATISGPAPAGTGNTTSTSFKQDAQLPQPGQNIDLKLVGEEDFDLDGAIDELGSYLGTWDPEDEASRLQT